MSTKNKFLVVVDMQQDFLTSILGNEYTKAIVPNVVKLVNEFVDDNLPVIFTLDTHSDTTYTQTREGRYLPIPHCLYGTEGWNLIPELKKFVDNVRVGELSKVDSFGFWNLNDYLKHEFLCEKEYESYGDFLFEQSTEKEIRESIISAANRYESAIKDGRMPSVDELDEIYSSLDKRTSYFISLVLKALRRDFLTGSLKAKKAISILKAIDDASLSNAVYNQNIKSAFDLALREAMSVD